MLRNGLALAGSILGAFATSVSAADLPAPAMTDARLSPAKPGFYLHVGPGGLILDESAKIYALGQEQVGANISIKSQLTLIVEAGYFVTPNVALSFTGGLPPFAKIEAAGTMDGLGRIGGVTYGPTTFTAHYHFRELGRLQPYVGIGPAFMYVFDEKDGLMSNLNVRNAVGLAFQVGADYMISDHWGIFFDLKKAILRSEATGSLGPAPIKGDLKLDPLVLHTGLTYRF